MLIADIAGYTRFMKFHDTSLAHAQQIVARLLEVVIDAAGPSLPSRSSKATRHSSTCRCRGRQLDPALVAGHAAAIYRAFHCARRISA